MRSTDTLLAHKDARDQVSKIIPENLEEIENFKADNLDGFLNSDRQKISDLHKNHIDVGKTGTKTPFDQSKNPMRFLTMTCK